MRAVKDTYRWPVWILAALAVGTMFVWQACSRSDAVASTATARPTALRVGWMPNDEEPERRVRLDIFVRYLARRLQMPVELVQTGQYSTQIEALRAAKIDVGSMGPFAYVIGREKAPIEPLIAAGQPDGESNTYRSCFIVPANSPLRSIADVKERAASLTLAWVDPASASGHLVPRARLEAAGLAPEKDFKQVFFALNHLASVMTVKAGKVDVAAVSLNTLNRLVEKNRIAAGDVRVIWESEPIVTSLTVVRSDLPAAFRAELQQAYLEFPTSAPEDWAKYTVNFTVPNSVWVAATDSDFDGLRELARNVRHLDLLE
jgi:phosphonate transport system substrate-binding protein